MSHKRDAPKRIYLQVCGDDDCDAPFAEHAEITWCVDKINASDVEYVRADLARRRSAAPDSAPTQEKTEC